MKILWAPEAELDRLAIFQYISTENIQAAIAMDERFSQMVGQLGEFPNLGKPGLIDGTRELIPHRSYRVIYEVSENEIWILAIVHTARQWPPLAEAD